MRNKILFATLGCTLAMSMIFAGCGKQDPTVQQVAPTPTVEVTPSAAAPTPTDEPTTTPIEDEVDPNLALMNTEINDGVLSIIVDMQDYQWTSFFEDDLEIETLENDGILTFTIKGLSAIEESYVQVVGNNSTTQVSYLVTFTVNEDLTIANAEFDCITTDMSTEGGDVEVIEVDEDLNNIATKVLDAIGEENLPYEVNTQMIDVLDATTMSFMLGAETFDGIQSVAISESPMSSTAFSLGTLKFDTKENAESAATKLLDTAPIQKWVCVIPEEVKTKVVDDNYVVFIMCSKDVADIFETIEF